jgi:ABC-type nitrate/sulfonate/bicarbonate transport system substrate-binding protein
MALKPYGLDATKDLKLLQVGNSPDRWAALSSHQVQAAIIDEDSFVKQAESQGFKVLISLKKTPYAATVLAAQDAFLKQNPNTTLAALRGLSDSVRFFNDDRNKADVMAVIGRELRLPVSDPQVEASWEAIHARLDPDPYPDKQGVQVVLDALKDVDAGRYSALTADQLIDASFAEKLRAS